MHKYIKILLSILLCVSVGVIASYFTIAEIKTWYAGLAKPDWRPPNNWFGPVWTTLYIMMGISLGIVWSSSSAEKPKAIRLFAIQLLLNGAWSIIFFTAHQIGWALVDILLLWIMILLTFVQFQKVSGIAAWLLVPYLLWVSFAAVLNFAIWRIN